MLQSFGFTMVNGAQCDGVLVLHANKTKVGTLVRVETAAQAAMYRLTVKASTPDIATAFAEVLEGVLRTLGNNNNNNNNSDPQQDQQQQQPDSDPTMDIFNSL